MFTEITGNADLYAPVPCACRIFCRDSCFDACMWEVPSFMVLADELMYVVADVRIEVN